MRVTSFSRAKRMAVYCPVFSTLPFIKALSERRDRSPSNQLNRLNYLSSSDIF